MSAPKRIQRKRTRGWRMPEGAVYVGRGSRWGNPFRWESPSAIAALERGEQEAGRRAIGIEIEERWCEATAKRLDDFVPGPREQQQMFAGVQL